MVEPRKGKHDKVAATSGHDFSHTVLHDATEEYVFTLDATTREVVNVQERGPDGQYRAISDEQWATLVSDDEVEAMMQAAQNAYSAGLIEGLKQTPDTDEPEDFALLQLLGDEQIGVGLMGPELRLALERRLLLRQLLRRHLLLQASPDTQQTQRHIAKGASNGSAKGV